MEEKIKELIIKLMTNSMQEDWERAFVEISVATFEMSVKYEYRYIACNKELRSLSVSGDLRYDLFDLLTIWCSSSLKNPSEKWNRIHFDFTSSSENFYRYWDQWYYDDLYQGM